MTANELQSVESELQKRGYRKFTRGLTANETYGWFKTFDKDGDGFLIEFRVWKHEMPYTYPVEHHIGFDVYFAILGLSTYVDLEHGWKHIADIATFESMAAEFNQLVRKYTNNNQR